MDKVLVIALGNRYREDDGVGPAMLDELRKRWPTKFDYLEHSGDPSDLMERWENRRVMILDAVKTSDMVPGRVHLFLPLKEKMTRSKATSSHALSIGDAVELGQLLNKLPRELQMVAIEGERFSQGAGLSKAVETAISEAINLAYQKINLEEIVHA